MRTSGSPTSRSSGSSGSTVEQQRCSTGRSSPSSAGGTPAERIKELAPKIPSPKAVHAAYDPSREFIRSQNTRYRWLPTDARVT